MSEKKTPIFRKSVKGYKREDVNNYIISLNKNFEDNKRMYEKALNDCNARAASDYERICKLSEELQEKEMLISILTDKVARFEELCAEISAKDGEIAALKERNADLEEAVESYTDSSEDERAKAEYYDNVCSKAGEILVIASSTAEDILNRANDEATKIVGDANVKKDLMLKTFSRSVDAAADDINVYIKKSVDECINKINKSVNEVSLMAAEDTKKPKAVFIGEK